MKKFNHDQLKSILSIWIESSTKRDFAFEAIKDFINNNVEEPKLPTWLNDMVKMTKEEDVTLERKIRDNYKILSKYNRCLNVEGKFICFYNDFNE